MISKMVFEVFNLEFNNKIDEKVMLFNTFLMMFYGKLFYEVCGVLDNLLYKIKYNK